MDAPLRETHLIRALIQDHSKYKNTHHETRKSKIKELLADQAEDNISQQISDTGQDAVIYNSLFSTCRREFK